MKDFQVHIDEFLPLRDVVFQTLRRAILMGDLEPGERLMELQLTEKLGVSRTPIREAIRKLELEGLVTMVPRKGASVASITEKDLQDVIEVRCCLEELSVCLACDRISEEEIEHLSTCMDEFAAMLKEGDITEIAEKDVEFHDIIFNATKNARLIQMLFNLREQMYRYRLEYLKNPKTHEQLLEEHRSILRFVKEHNAAKAQEAIRSHIVNQGKAIQRKINDDPNE